MCDGRRVRAFVEREREPVEGLFRIEFLPRVTIDTGKTKIGIVNDQVQVVALLFTNGDEIDVRGKSAMEINAAIDARWRSLDQKPSMYRGTFAVSDATGKDANLLESALNARLHKKRQRDTG